MLSSNGRRPRSSYGFVGLWTAFLAVALPAAVWAVSPEMLPSPVIWMSFMQKVREQESFLIHEEDTDADGVPDYKVYRHRDGSYIDVKLRPGPNGLVIDIVRLRDNLKDEKAWVYGFDKNGDGQIDMVVRGMFAEGKWKDMLYDSDGDGRPDKFLLDLDTNGVYDSMGTDDNGDGKLDRLYDMDNKTGEILNETVGWVEFKEEQRREALPHLVYSFVPTLKALTAEQPEVVGARWDFGDGATRETEQLAQGEHRYAKPGIYEVDLEVQFRVPGDDKIWRAWRGISLRIEPPPPGPLPLTAERLPEAVTIFYGACGLVTAEERPKTGPISQLWPDVQLPETAPIGEALRASAIAPGELELAVFWWRSGEEADAFLDALEAVPDPKPQLPVLAARAKQGKPIEIVSKVRGRVLDTPGARTAVWREGGFIIVLTTNRTAEELERWARLLYDILHPAPEVPETAPAPAG